MRNDFAVALVILALILGAIVGYFILRSDGGRGPDVSARLEQRSETADRPAAPIPAPPSSNRSDDRARDGQDRARLGVEVERGAAAQRP
jgi:hypothetical protein